MVHRKSTYKLAFKNLSKDIRKSIWEENSLLRESRRTKEMSHHSIDECDSNCECDSDDDEEDEDDESEDQKYYKDLVAIRKEREDLKNKNDVNARRKSSNASEITDKSEHSAQSDTDKLYSCARKDKLHSMQSPEEVDKSFRSSYQHSPERQRKMFNGIEKFPTDRRYVSETDLKNLHKTLATKGRRGVMKYSKLTGELDLIPARLQVIKQEKQTNDKNENRASRHSPSNCSISKSILNIRPRTTLLSMSRPPSGKIKERPYSSEGRVSFSDEVEPSKLELRSSRREPRVGYLKQESDPCAASSSLCLRCGQKIKQRGILT